MVDSAGEPLSGAATQRRTLALLAVLAVAGNSGLSRDKLIGLLWPESDAERARHSLTQALYAVRRALREDELLVVTASDVRLNPERLTSDVREMEESLDAGDLERAVGLYQGPFLDGFFLSGSAEFDQWMSAQRQRLEARVADALERLAARAEEGGDPRGSLEWRRRLASLLPLDAGIAVKLMSAMAAVGDRAGAVQHARVHATLLREQLDLDADPVVEALAEKLRGAVAWTDDAASRPAPVSVVGEENEVSEASIAPIAPSAVGAWVPSRRMTPRWMRAMMLSVILVALGSIAVLLWRNGGKTPDALPGLPARQKVVVAPFRVAGADASLSYLREGMVELLSTRLADDTAATSVDAGAVLAAWRAAGLTSTADVARDTVVKLATRLGAERAVIGSVVGSPSRAVLSATVLLLPKGTVSAQASVSGPVDSITALIDRLAARLLVSEAGQDESLSHYTSRSLPALQAFLAGQTAFRAHDYADAIRHYDRALGRDSSFALAALYKALSADRLNLEPPLRSGVAIAWASRGNLNDRDQALLLALVGPRYPALPSAAEQTAAWQRIVDLAPGSADAWYALGARLLKDGAAAGIASPRERAIAALRRALTLSPQHLPARELLAQAESTSAPPTRRARSRADVSRVDMVLAEHALAITQGRASDALEATTRLRRLQPSSDAWMRLRVLDALYAGGDSVAAEDAARSLAELTSSTPLRVPTTWDAWLANACVVGQWRLARGDTTRVSTTITQLRARRTLNPATRVAATPEACAELLDASLAIVLRRRDARARLLRTDSLVFTPQVAGDASAYASLALARGFERLGDVDGALRAIRKRSDLAGSTRYLATSLREESRLAALRSRTPPR